MKAEECIDGLKEIMHNINPKADLSNVDLNTNLVNDLGLNSLSMLMMALAIEDKFNIRFDNPEPFTTVGDICTYIVQQQK
ncbi:MAG: phosphopantetheine-binding protein [Bacteroidales bacterium]|nr:phosphopantetheine-binding protein [Bacteroidales bacterium]